MAEVAEITVNPTSKGLAVIITNDYADAALGRPKLCWTHLDGERMRDAFEALNFDVCWKRNINQNDIQRLWHEISSFTFDSVKHYNCMAFIFSGQGESKDGDGKLIMQDDTKIDICDNFIAPVLPGNAKMIGDIPKIFFIDACRGDSNTKTVDVPARNEATHKRSVSIAISRRGSDLQKVPTEGNFLVAYSTLPGCISNEYIGRGSLWLEILARHLMTSHETIEVLLTDVNMELLDFYRTHDLEFQQPEKLSRLNERLYLLGGSSGDYTAKLPDEEKAVSMQNHSQPAPDGKDKPDSLKTLSNSAADLVYESRSVPSQHLSLIKWKDDQGQTQKFFLRDKISHKWRDIGERAGLTFPELENISEKYRSDPKECCRAVLGQWLDNPPPDYPTTWQGLLELLEDSQLCQVVSELRAILDGSRHLVPSVVPRPIEPYRPSPQVHTQQPTNQIASEGCNLSEGCNSSAPSQPVQSAPGPTHREVVPRARYKKGTGKYCVHLKQFTNPKFDYITDRGSGSSTTRHHCTISYWKNGRKQYTESGYCTSIIGAEEQAVKKVLSRENWPPCD